VIRGRGFGKIHLVLVATTAVTIVIVVAIFTDQGILPLLQREFALAGAGILFYLFALGGRRVSGKPDCRGMLVVVAYE
jgi:hypothetical protein